MAPILSALCIYPTRGMRRLGIGNEKIPRAMVTGSFGWHGARCGISDQILIDCAIHLDAFFSEDRLACTRHALNHTCSWSLGEHEQGRRQDEERGAHLGREVNLGCPSLSDR